MNYTAVTLKVLEYLGRDPAGSHHVREVAEEAGVSVGAASITLRALLGQRLVKADEKGGSKFYTIDLSNAAAREFKILFNVLGLKDLIEVLKEYAERVVLFGSCAEGIDERDSDIDLYVLALNLPAVKDVARIAICFIKQKTYISYFDLLRHYEESSGALRAFENRLGDPGSSQSVSRFDYRTRREDR